MAEKLPVFRNLHNETLIKQPDTKNTRSKSFHPISISVNKETAMIYPIHVTLGYSGSPKVGRE